jgi:predicted  nucleic acid-binding Zn-ribbon protein
MCRSEIEILKERIKSLEDQVEELHACIELLRDDIATLQQVTGLASDRVVVPRE